MCEIDNFTQINQQASSKPPTSFVNGSMVSLTIGLDPSYCALGFSHNWCFSMQLRGLTYEILFILIAVCDKIQS